MASLRDKFGAVEQVAEFEVTTAQPVAPTKPTEPTVRPQPVKPKLAQPVTPYKPSQPVRAVGLVGKGGFLGIIAVLSLILASIYGLWFNGSMIVSAFTIVLKSKGDASLALWLIPITFTAIEYWFMPDWTSLTWWSHALRFHRAYLIIFAIILILDLYITSNGVGPFLRGLDLSPLNLKDVAKWDGGYQFLATFVVSILVAIAPEPLIRRGVKELRAMLNF